MRRPFFIPANDIVSRELDDPWWDRLGLIKAGTRFNVPALRIGSWYDYDVAEDRAEFMFFRTNADAPVTRDNQFIVISTGNHLPVGAFQGARRHQ